MIYNGGLLVAPLRYFDANRQRPGLPPDVAALVTAVREDAITLMLVNLNAFVSRSVLIQAGSFGEHEFDAVRYIGRGAQSVYPFAEANYTYTASIYSQPDPMSIEYQETVDNKYLVVELPPANEMQLTLTLRRYMH